MPRPPNTDERRLEIVQGVLDVLATQGLRKTSTQAIARAAGLSPGLVHYHFRTKSEVLAAAVEHLVEEHRQRVGVALATAGPGALERVEAWIDASADARSKDPRAVACWVALAGEATSDDTVKSALRQGLESMGGGLDPLLVELASHRQSGADLAALRTAMLASIVGAFLIAHAADGQVPQGFLAASLRQLVQGALPLPGGQMTPMVQRLGLLAALYLSQGLPYGFFTQALPVLLRHEGATLPQIGLATLLALPWALKFLWAPVLDRGPLTFGRVGFTGRRRSWIVPLQALSAGALLVAAGFEPSTAMPVVLFIVLVTNFLAATQDIATDGLAVEILRPQERGWGNGVQVAGYRVGMILGGGALLVVFEQLGWALSFVAMAGLLLVASIPVWFLREPTPAAELAHSSLPTSWRAALAGSLKRPGMSGWVALLVLYKTGDAFAVGMLRPFLVDSGLSLTDIGWMLGGIGFGAGLVGALAGGWVATRFSRVQALLSCGVLQVVAVALYVPCALSEVDRSLLTVVIGLDHLAGGMATATLFTLMMDVSRREQAGTDYTVQASIVVFSTGIGAALAGLSAEMLGHAAHFALGVLVSSAGLLWIAWRARAVFGPLADAGSASPPHPGASHA